MSNPLHDRLFGRHETSDAPFLIHPGGGVTTYAAFVGEAARISNVLRERGMEPGDRLAAQVEKSPQALALYAACVRSGVVFLPLNTGYTTDELTYFVQDSGAKMLVCDPARAEALTPLATGQGAALDTLDAQGGGSLMDAAAGAQAAPVVERSSDDLAALLYTSGTTGRSKGAMLTQGNLLSNAQTLVEHWRFTEEDRLIHALPIFHTHGLFVATNVTLMAGGALIYMPKFDIDTILGAMPQATAMMGVPTFYTRLLSDDRFTRDIAEPMRLFVSGSAPLMAETHRQFEERTGHRILERYGMTETNMNASNPYDGERRPGAVGFPLPGVELKITDPATGEKLPDGEVGQIEVRGSNVFKGYWQMPEKTREELREDGFFITGDLGQIDEDGYVHIVGRNKDLIISGGYNIYPKEIEVLLDEAPGVLESAVIGVPHPDFGETVVGVLVPKPGETPDTEAVAASIAGSLARFKQPRRLVVVDELPRNTMSKVQKNILRERYADLFAE